MNVLLFNPYTPGAGRKPAHLAGRDDVLREADEVLLRINHGLDARPKVYYGLRGVGKTVLLNAIEAKALDHSYLCDIIEISENDDFRNLITTRLRSLFLEVDRLAMVKEKVVRGLRLLKAFSFKFGEAELSIDVEPLTGYTDSGIFQNDLTQMMVALGEAARDNGIRICLLFDEMQYMKSDDLEGLIGALHRVSQLSLPICFFGSGLPSIHQLLGDTKSYTERLFDFVEIGSLEENNANDALTTPAIQQGVHFTPEAIHEVIRITEGYPYFIQEFGYILWDKRNGSDIDRKIVEDNAAIFLKKLDDGFFKSRYDRSTECERQFMFAMASLGGGPYSIADVARKLNRKQKSLGVRRASLIHKGFIYSSRHGEIDFTVPQFKQYLDRIKGSES